jgi:chromate transporter
VTFVPTYLFILIGAPYVERLRGHGQLSAALAAVTAAVVGVILNLAVWFAWQTAVTAEIVNGQSVTHLDGFVVIVCVAAFAALHFFKVNLASVIVACGVLGLARAWF